MATTRSKVLYQSIIDRCSADPDFVLLPQGQQIQRINVEIQNIINFSNEAHSKWFEESTFAAPLAGSGGGGGTPTDERSGWGVASIAGTPIIFTNGPLPDNGYVLLVPFGIRYTDPSGNDTRTRNGFTAYAADDNTPFGYFAKEPT